MTEADRVRTTQILIGDSENATDDVVKVYLRLAESKMIKRLYPFEPSARHIPLQYEMDLCELAARMFNRRGAEGETSHNENSVSRTYGSVDDEDILARLTPFAKIVGYDEKS